MKINFHAKFQESNYCFHCGTGSACRLTIHCSSPVSKIEYITDRPINLITGELMHDGLEKAGV
jgi:hypothetical protein